MFELRGDHLTLTEIAPGVEPERDVLAQCGAPVPVASDLKTMGERIFRESPMAAGRTGLVPPAAQA